jgi:hypothetical protein
MTQPASHDLELFGPAWPNQRLADLHRLAVDQRVERGELRRAAELHAIAQVVACASPDERAQMRNNGLDEEGVQ